MRVFRLQNCDACIIDLDHHCHFVNKCISRSNRHLFVKFLVSCSIYGFYAASQCRWVMEHVYCLSIIEGHTSSLFGSLDTANCVLSSHPGLLWNYLSTTLCAFWVSFLLVNQMYFVATETTQYYVMKERHVIRDKYCFEGRHWKNIVRFLRTGTFDVRLRPQQGVVMLSSGSAEAQALLLQGEMQALSAERMAAIKREYSWKNICCKLLSIVFKRSDGDDDVATSDIHSGHDHHECCGHDHQHEHVHPHHVPRSVPGVIPTVLGQVVPSSAGSSGYGTVVGVSSADASLSSFSPLPQRTGRSGNTSGAVHNLKV
jgi:hypothetical protein